MKLIIVSVMIALCAGCTVTRDQLEQYDKRVEQAEKALEKAQDLLAKAERKADHKAISEAQKVAGEAAAALKAAKEARPEEGEPWWVAIAGIAGAALGGFVGHRRGLYQPVPKK